jgi:triacylglycerol lipase
MEEISQPIVEKKASQLTLHSKPCNPRKGQNISSLTTIERALLFAELSMIAYLAPDQTKKAAKRLGFTKTNYYDNDGSQAYSFTNKEDIVIAFRGTEPNEWNDIKADMDATKAIAETVGKVHRGFKKEVDDIWPQLEEMLAASQKMLDKKLWFTGHSLGGAMAAICAGRCLLSDINTSPEQIHTFGCPRVGTKRYINYAKVDYYRWVNNNDVIPRIPPVWFGYRHTGKEMYLDSSGRLRKLNKIQRSADLWKGFVRGLKNYEIDYFSDHLIDCYVEYIHQTLVDSVSID